MDIKSMLIEAGIYQDWMEGHEIMEVTMPSFELFANLIAEATKEKAAKVCEEYGNSVNNDWNKQLGVADDLVSIAEECAAAIRSMK